MPGSSCHIPMATNAWIIVMSTAAPSTMAASTTWPWPERDASSRPHTTPKARSIPPPPKSPTMLRGGTGRSPFRVKLLRTPASAM